MYPSFKLVLYYNQVTKSEGGIAVVTKAVWKEWTCSTPQSTRQARIEATREMNFLESEKVIHQIKEERL